METLVMMNEEAESQSDFVEAWLEQHPHFTQDYFARRGNRAMVDKWLTSHALAITKLDSSDSVQGQNPPPVRKVSSQDFESPLGTLRPMVSTVDGTPTFISADNFNSVKSSPRSSPVLRRIDEKDLMWELVTDICNDLDVDSVCHKILCYVSLLTSADRCSLFLVHGADERYRCLVSKLFDVNSNTRLDDCVRDGQSNQERIFIPWGKGIAGYVAQHGQPVVIPDAYEDSRFHNTVDEQTGYRTKSLMCLPIKDTHGEIIGVAQAVNKNDSQSGVFDEEDHKTFAAYLAFCGIVLRNAQLYETSRLENKRNQVLLDLARMICEEQSRLNPLTEKIMKNAQSLLQCQRCQILLVAEDTKHEDLQLPCDSKSVFSKVFEFESGHLNGDSKKKPLYSNVAAYVATTGKKVNIQDISRSDMFESPKEDERVKTKSVLCVPIRSADHRIVIGVFQLINKLDGSHFTQNDEQIFEAFAIFCGIGIENTVMHDQVAQAQARQSVALEILAYHTAAAPNEVQQLKDKLIPSSHAFNLDRFCFSDLKLTDDKTIEGSLRMFLDLNLIEKFDIKYEYLCRWLLSVKKNYRDVSYHNWRHAFNVAQYMFAMLKTGRMMNMLTDLEAMCLIVACLCHDLDHRGTNNQFQLKTASPLSTLYSTSVMEHHHFDRCIMLLNINGNQIFSNLSPDQYDKAIEILEHAILATDLALYFQKRESFFKLVKKETADWKQPDNRRLLFAMMMTACDVSSITKPWEVQQKVAMLVANEFFEQGDLEKAQLNELPLAHMDRERKHEVPSLQVNFIDSLCMPVYKSFAEFSEHLKPMHEGCKQNRVKWSNLAEENKKKPDQRQHIGSST